MVGRSATYYAHIMLALRELLYFLIGSLLLCESDLCEPVRVTPYLVQICPKCVLAETVPQKYGCL